MRDRFNARQFISWLQDVDDKYDRMKVSVLYSPSNCTWAGSPQESPGVGGGCCWVPCLEVTVSDSLNPADTFRVSPPPCCLLRVSSLLSRCAGSSSCHQLAVRPLWDPTLSPPQRSQLTPITTALDVLTSAAARGWVGDRKISK